MSGERQKSSAATAPTKKASLLAQYDELVRYGVALGKGDEEEVINILNRQENARKLWLALQEEHDHCETSISSMERDNLSLETQLKHARNQIELEMDRRKRAERDREALEKQIGSIREMLVDKKDNSIMSDIDRDKLFPVLNSTYQSSPGGGGISPAKRAVSAAVLGLHLGQGGPPPARATSTTTLTPRRRILDTIDESSNSLIDDDISYDKTLDDDFDDDYDDGGTPVIANFTVRRSAGRKGRKSGKRPSAPPLEEHEDEEIENKARKSDEGIRLRRSQERKVAGGGGDMVVVDCSQATPHGRRSATTMTTTTKTTPMNKMESSPSLRRTPGGSATILRTPSTVALSPGKGLSHPHTFVEKTIVRMETCQPCGKRITFGKTAGKCRDCKSICHLECRHLVPVPCIASSAQKSGSFSTPQKGHAEKGYLADLAPIDRPQVPGIIVHCVKEVEARGLSEAGLYRVPGSEVVVKDLLQRFLKGKGMPNLARIDDINVVCSLLKHFLRQLREPVTTYPLWSSFVQASSLYKSGSLSDSVSAVQDAVTRLPPANRDTLAFLLLHLIRVAETPATRMPVQNLAKVFGPTIVGYSSPEPEALQMLNEPRMQADVLEMLMSGIGPAFWEGIVKADDASWMSFNTTNGDATVTTLGPNAPPSYSSVVTPRRSTRGNRGTNAAPLYLKVQSSSPVFQ